jgi:hypothetical protein
MRREGAKTGKIPATAQIIPDEGFGMKRQTPEADWFRGSSKHQCVGKPCLEHTFALCLLARQFARTADRFSFLACFFLGRLFEMLLELHFTKNAFTLQLFLQSAERLIYIVVTNTNLHVVFTTFLSWICKELQEADL